MSFIENLKNQIELNFDENNFELQEVYKMFPEKPKETVRARIYENLGICFERVSKGVYRYTKGETDCLLVEGDGRDLSFIKDGSIDVIITDHPWRDGKSNEGGNRNFANYDTFRYEQSDFDEKFRVLKYGAFLIEIVPDENENNFDYLYSLKKMAQESGFKYFTKTPWKKGSFVANTGRKSKNSEDVLIFTKGACRNLRRDEKKIKASSDGELFYMSGASAMVPTCFNFDPPKKADRIHQAEKPVELMLAILKLFSLEGETVLDQFAGSGVVGEAALLSGRNSILIEKNSEDVQKIQKRLQKIVA